MDSRGTADPNPVTTTTAAPGTESCVVEVRPQKTRDDCLRALGYAIIYIRWMKPWFLETKEGVEQYRRVKLLCKEVAVEWHRSDGSEIYWSYMHERIINETENLC